MKCPGRFTAKALQFETVVIDVNQTEGRFDLCVDHAPEGYIMNAVFDAVIAIVIMTAKPGD